MTLIEGLHQVWRHGYAHIPNAVSAHQLENILAEVGSASLSPAAPTQNGVEQNFEMWAGKPDEVSMRRIIELGQHFRRESDLFNGYRWNPNEVSIQRYAESAIGIGPHRDARRFVGLVVAVNVSGNAVFTIYDDDRTTVRAGWRLEPGDIVLMEGYQEGKDRRPIHSVSGGRGGERISLTYRMMK